MPTFLERYREGDRVEVWNDLTALGEGVRHELYYEDAAGVAAETMRRARHNVEELIRRLDAIGYRFQDSVSTAEDQITRLEGLTHMSELIQSRLSSDPARRNVHSRQMIENMLAMKAKMAPMLQQAADQAVQKAAARRRSPLEDSQVFDPPGKKTARQLAKLEKMAGGPMPISLRAWYEQVGGVSLIGSHPVLNAVDFGNRQVQVQFASMLAGQKPVPIGSDVAPDPLVIIPLEELLSQAEEADGEDELQLVIAPDDLHKANVSGDAYYITLPDSGADFQFDDWQRTTFVNYLRSVFEWGGFPGWKREPNPPRKEIEDLSHGLLPI